MKTTKWKVLFITDLICLLPIIPCLFLWNKLPDQIAIHFNMNNVADNFAPKWVAVFILPLFMVALQTFCCIVTDIKAKKHGAAPKFEAVTKWIIPLMSIILQTVTVAYSLEYKVDIRRIVMVMLGIIFVAMGNYMPKLNYVKNYNISADKAKKINRFTGFAMVIMGILSVVTVFFPPVVSVVWVVLVLLFAILCTVYTIWQVKTK